ncbi:sugar ABC transporter substrate-binding protein [Pararhodobacter sp.]|uniref:sugar ABC transporter substrate-binding protein n=1 Tax=Pararhodobacter sp. TaxID=2127056 RepID=UPI002FDDE82A
MQQGLKTLLMATAATALAVSSAAAQDRTTIAFVSFTQDITDLYGQVLSGLRGGLDGAGFDYSMTTAAPPSPDDFAGMDRILADVATVAPDFAVIGGASFELIEDRIRQIEEGGTTTIIVDVLPTSLPEPPDVSPLTWIAVDHREMGRVGGEYMGQQFCQGDKDQIRTVLFWGPAASEISQNRIGGAVDALEQELEACGKSLEIAQEVFADFNRERSFNLMTGIATAQPNLDLVIGANSNTALGVMDAMDSLGLLGGQTQILGMGGQLDELAAICRGDIAAAGFRDANRMGRVTAEAIIAAAAGDAESVPEITSADLPVLYDCEGVFATVPRVMLELDGFRTAIPASMWDEYAN